MDGEDSGDGLRGKEEEERKVKRGALNQDFLQDDHSANPERSDDTGYTVDEHHFGKLKELRSFTGPDERESKEEEVEEKDNSSAELFSYRHGAIVY